MQSSQAPYVDRPQIAFRVGVSGAVSFDASQLDRVSEQVAEVLQNIRDEVHRCATTETAKHVYDSDKPILLRLISPLADGADRLVARAAAKDFQLEVPMPFDQERYKATFANTTQGQHAAHIAEFATLLATANPRVLTLDGASAEQTDRHRSYEAVGRLVVRNCDLLIAIWDDEKASRGRGGTADTLHFALRGNVPVWWIHAAKQQSPKFLQDTLDLPRYGVPKSPEPDSLAQLRGYIATAILPPDPVAPAFQGVWDRIMACLRGWLGVQIDPLRTFLAETRAPNRKMWNLHPNFIRALRTRGARLHARRTKGSAVATDQSTASSPTPLTAEAPQPRQPPFASWTAKLTHRLAEPFRRNPRNPSRTPASGLSAKYQHRYRSSYTVVFVCGAIALISAVIGLAFGKVEFVLTFIELLMLCSIVGLVLTNQLQRWHERYISYRMLAELERLSPYLQKLGWGLPGSRVHNLAHSTRRHWVAWFFAATMRAMPLAQGGFTEDTLGKTRRTIIDDLIGEQLRFHYKRHVECSGADHILARWGRVLFMLTLAIVLTRVILSLNHSGHALLPLLSLLCALLPAAAGAFFGLRAYEELGVLAEQSEQMHETLTRAQARIERIAIDKPLASQALGAELFDVATIMLSDVAGWAQLFRLKAVDA